MTEIITDNLFLNMFQQNYDSTQFLLSKDDRTTVDLIEKYHDFKWSWQGLSVNPNLTQEFIANNLDKDWDFCNLSFHKSVTWNFLLQNPSSKWCYLGISKNHNLTWENIKELDKNKLYMYHIVNNPNITEDIITSNPDYNWNFNICTNANISKEFIENYNNKDKIYIDSVSYENHPIFNNNYSKGDTGYTGNNDNNNDNNNNDNNSNNLINTVGNLLRNANLKIKKIF